MAWICSEKLIVYFVFTNNQTKAPFIVYSKNIPDKHKGDIFSLGFLGCAFWGELVFEFCRCRYSTYLFGSCWAVFPCILWGTFPTPSVLALVQPWISSAQIAGSQEKFIQTKRDLILWIYSACFKWEDQHSYN